LEILEYVVKGTGDPDVAEILRSGKLVGTLKKVKDGQRTILKTENGSNRIYQLDPKVNGEIFPFSATIYENGNKQVLKIKSGVFSYKGKVYMFKSLPEGKSMNGHLSGLKYINRLDDLPYHDIDEIDRMTWEKLNKHRGVEVGTISGFGKLEHKVSLGEGLADIGLPLAAASYLLYSTG
jgi:hypothetical protein